MNKKSSIWILILILIALLIWWLNQGGVGLSSDLVVFSNSAPASVTKGLPMAVGDVISNQSGTVQAGNSFTCMFLNTNKSIVGAAFLGSHMSQAVGPKMKVSWSGSVTVPAGQTLGSNYFITVCDCSNNVNETSDANNTNTCVVIVN